MISLTSLIGIIQLFWILREQCCSNKLEQGQQNWQSCEIPCGQIDQPYKNNVNTQCQRTLGFRHLQLIKYHQKNGMDENKHETPMTFGPSGGDVKTHHCISPTSWDAGNFSGPQLTRDEHKVEKCSLVWWVNISKCFWKSWTPCPLG